MIRLLTSVVPGLALLAFSLSCGLLSACNTCKTKAREKHNKTAFKSSQATGTATRSTSKTVSTNKSDLFARGRVLQIEIELPAADWETIRHQSRTAQQVKTQMCQGAPYGSVFTSVKGKITVDGTTLDNVGIRKKGFLGSLNRDKPSLKIKFDKFTPGQKLLGSERMTLNNSLQDGSLVRQCLASKLFKDSKLPAPRCNFANVTVNGVHLGVYAHIEDIKKDFLRTHFGDPEGHLYEGVQSDLTALGLMALEQKTNKKTPYDRSDLRELEAALSDRSPGFHQRLERLVDLDQFVKFWALETLISHWDGYTNHQNNYFLYRVPSSRKFTFIPWGLDQVLRRAPPYRLIQPENPLVFSTGRVAHLSYRDPVLRAHYFEAMASLLEQWDEVALVAEINRMYRLIAPYTLQSIRKDIRELKKFIRQQGKNTRLLLSRGAPKLTRPFVGCATSTK